MRERIYAPKGCKRRERIYAPKVVIFIIQLLEVKKKNIESLNERLMKLYNILKALSASLIVYLDTDYCELEQCNDGVVLAK
jgi:hypothetical protein